MQTDVEDRINPDDTARTQARRLLLGSLALLISGVVAIGLVFDKQPRPWGTDVQIKLEQPKKLAQPELTGSPSAAPSNAANRP